MNAIRTKFLDFHGHPVPKTNWYCIKCQKDLKPGQPHRIIRWELDTYMTIHPDDWDRAAAIIDRRIEEGPLGMDCAKKHGMEWSAPA